MAHIHRLVFCLALTFLSWLPTTAQAETIPATSVTNPTVLMWPMSFGSGPDAGKTRIYSSAVLACQAGLVNYGASMSSYVRTDVTGITANCIYGPPGLPNTGSWGSIQAANACVTSGALSTASCVTFSCPAGQNWTLSGNQCTRPDCVAPATRDAATGQCKGPCEAGTPVTSTSDSGWGPSGDLVTGYSYDNSERSKPGCVNRQGVGCTVAWGERTANPREQQGANGNSFWTVYLNGVTTGAMCAVVAPSGQPPEPACAGQSGMVNGTYVCLPRETPAERDRRAAEAARQAAAAARAAAAAAGRTAAQADAAARAAGDAAAQATRNGSSGASAAAAGAAAGAAAATALAGGASPSTSMQQGTAAGSGQAAADRALTMATASGASQAVRDRAVAAARTAAEIAAAGVIANGGTAAQAAAAAAAAGQTATATVLIGSTNEQAAEAGANAGAGEAAAGNNGTGGTGSPTPGAPGDPAPPTEPTESISDFCTKNPQAKMCKNEFDSTFAGSCAAAPICTGDAVMCAIAAATHKQECNWRPGASTESAAYDAAKVRTGDQTGTLAGNTSVSISSASFDQTELLGGAGGIADRTITVMDSSIALPFSTVNIWLQRLGYILQAVTFLLCIRIVTRG